MRSEKEPLLYPTTPPAASPSSTRLPPFSLRKKYFSALPSFSSANSNPNSPLCPLPENDALFIPVLNVPSPSPRSLAGPNSLIDLLLFGNPNSNSDPQSPKPPPSSSDLSQCPLLIKNNNNKKNLHRSRTAPAMSAIRELFHPADADSSGDSSSPGRSTSIVRQSLLLLLVYLSLGVGVYSAFPSHFSAAAVTHPAVDALYFCIVTMCTIGYGDITPATPFAKLFSVTFVLFGFGFIDILLSSMVSYVLDLQESLLLSSIVARSLPPSTTPAPHGSSYLVDVKKGRMRIRLKVALALAAVFLFVGLGAAVLRFVESLPWLDSFYLSVMSVTTVGYGDRAFSTLHGRMFASLWLLVSTLAVARAFLYLAEARIDKRHRQLAKWVLARDMTVSEFLAADIDHNGFVSKSEFVIYKLKEMGKITEKDILQICEQFDRLDTGNCGKITLADITQSHER